MSYYEDEKEYRSSAKFYRFVLKIAFNIAIIIILYKFLYIPDFTEELRNSSALYIMPILGIIGAFFYLSYWFGRNSSLYIIGVGGFSIGLIALTSFDTALTLYGLAILAGVGYLLYLFVKFIIRTLLKK